MGTWRVRNRSRTRSMPTGSSTRIELVMSVSATDFELMENEAKVLNTVTPDLRPFFKRGGKLLMYHGWNDRQVPAMSSVSNGFSVSSQHRPRRRGQIDPVP